MIRIWIYTSSLILLFACSRQDTPPSPKIFEDYYVRYVHDDGQWKAQARFFEGDSLETALPKRFRTSPDFQDKKLEARQLSEEIITYSIDYNAEYSQSMTFQYQSETGEPIRVDLSMPPLPDFTIDSIISLSSGATVTWKAQPLKQEESLIFLFTDEQNRAGSVVIEGILTDSTLLLTPTQLQSLTPGHNKLYLVKKQSKAFRLNQRTVFTLIEYYGKKLEVRIVP